jgi:hypothetical protein
MICQNIKNIHLFLCLYFNKTSSTKLWNKVCQFRIVDKLRAGQAHQDVLTFLHRDYSQEYPSTFERWAYEDYPLHQAYAQFLPERHKCIAVST